MSEPEFLCETFHRDSGVTPFECVAMRVQEVSAHMSPIRITYNYIAVLREIHRPNNDGCIVPDDRGHEGLE